MIRVLALAAALWTLAWVFDWPSRRRWGLLAGVWGAMVAAHLVLPATHPFRQATGGDVRVWLVLGGAGALLATYVIGLRALRARATALPVAVAAPGRDGARLCAPPQASAPSAPGPHAPGSAVTAQALGPYALGEVERYARHLFLPQIGGPGQRLLKEARVLVIGAGGLGSPILLYLAGAGVGRITVVDGDRVEASNLQRQIIHTDAATGLTKAQSAATAMQALNPFVAVQAVEVPLDQANGPALIAAHDLIIDGTDSFDTRALVNRLCVAAGKPLIIGALSPWEGQVSLFDPARGGPCYDCLFPVRPAPGSVPSCAEAGVAAPLPGVIGSLMAVEAIKHLTGAGQTLRGRLMIHDALFAETRVIGVKPRPGCPVCGAPVGA